MNGQGGHQTLDPAVEEPPVPFSYTRHSTLTVRRLTVGERRVVVKIATGRTRAPLRAEASVMELIGPELTPEVIAVREQDDRTDLVLDDVGSRTVGDLAELDVAGRLVVLETCARAVAALHRAGWTHGALCAEHVVLDDALGVRFVSLGSARPLSDASAARADDLAQLVGLVGAVARTPMCAGVRRTGWRRARRALGRLDSLGSPAFGSADEVACAISEIIRPLGRDRCDVGFDDQSSPPRLQTPLRAILSSRVSVRHRWTFVADRLRELHGDPLRQLAKVASVTALVLLVATVAPRVMGTAPAASDESRLGRVEPLVDTCPWGAVAQDPDGSPDAQLDLTGDGCADLVHVDGTTVQINGVAHRVGLEGDHVLLADDDCDGITQVHLVRPSTGEHFVFEELPGPDAPVRATLRSSRHVTVGDVGERLGRCTDRSLAPSPSTFSTGDPP